MKKFAYFLILTAAVIHPAFASFTNLNLQQVNDSLETIAPFVRDHETAISAMDRDIASLFADRLVEFLEIQLEAHLKQAQGKDPKEINANIEAAWQNLYKLRPSLRARFTDCTDDACVRKWVEAEETLFALIERIGTKKTVVEAIEADFKKAASKVFNRVYSLFYNPPQPLFVLDLSLVTAMYDAAAAKIQHLEVATRYTLRDLDITQLRTALISLLPQIAHSALDPEFTATALWRADSTAFSRGWRYSEYVWLHAIADARIKHLKGKVKEFIIPMRREYANRHILDCTNPSKSDIPAASRVSMFVGMKTHSCVSEQGGRYSVTGNSLGVDAGIEMTFSGTIHFRSAIPFHWFTPEGHAFKIEAGVVPGFGGHLGAGIRLDGIRVYEGEIEVGVGGGADLEISTIKQTESSHTI